MGWSISGLLASGLVMGLLLLVQQDNPSPSYGAQCSGGSGEICGPTVASGVFKTSGPIVSIRETGRVITGLAISSTVGPCVLIKSGTDISIQGNQIGPCGIDSTNLPSQGVMVNGGHGVNVYDNYIHIDTSASACCDSHDGIEYDGVGGGTIQGNIICYGESNIELQGPASRDITIRGNFLCNPQGPFPRGQNIQVWPKAGVSNNLTVTDNYAFSCIREPGGGIPCPANPIYPLAEVQEDSINIGHSDGVLVTGNYVAGGHSASGCGILVDEAANNVRISGNTLSDTGQCGIGIASGTGHKVIGNDVLNTKPVTGAGNTAIYVWNQYPSWPCGPVEISSNIADEKRPDGNSGFWDGGGCKAVTGTGNLYGSSLSRAISSPPAIPPSPKNCVAVAPYSTNTSLPRCG